MTSNAGEDLADGLVEALLKHDLQRFGARLGFIPEPTPISTEAAVQLLNLAERLSRSSREEAWNRCLLICGLLWEHRREEWAALPPFVMNLLSRIGLAPSMPMVNPSFQRNGYSYPSLGSITTEVAIEARNVEHEVQVAKRKALVLSTFQRDVWRAMDRHARLGISAPTSAGKSFVLLYKALDILSVETGPVVYIVPTISLIQQVTRDFREGAFELGLSDVTVLQAFEEPDVPTARPVYVLTQERALAALARSDAMRDASLVVVDEIQNVERAADEDEERAHTLFDVLQEIIVARAPRRAVVSGPRVENIGQLTKAFFGPDAAAVSQGLPPVVNITYSFAKTKKVITLRQYAPGVPMPGEIPVSFPTAAAKSIFGRRRYGPAAIDLLGDLLEKAMFGEGTLIFSPTSGQATQTALDLSERRIWPQNKPRLEELRDYAAETVHPRYALASCLPAGIAFHHGKVPQHIRLAVEEAFSSLDVRVLTCTTTLMQGVNLPAKNIIARNPNLFIRESEHSGSLTPYEFANLRGRAGRLLKDFVGRAVVLDESAFREEELDLSFPEKSVTAGYHERFERHRTEIIEYVEGVDPLKTQQPYSDLIVYIRQAVLRYGQGALERLARAGIIISDQEFSATARQVERLRVPAELCARAPYWDPIALNELFLANEESQLPEMPTNPFARGFTDTLRAILSLLQQRVPFYFSKYLGDSSANAIQSFAISAQHWASERPLKEMITWANDGNDVGWKEIDARLARVNQRVVYQLPKLLRPLSLMQNPENPILGMIELGAYHPEVRRLVELGIPRETAIRIQSRLGKPPRDGWLSAALLAEAARVSERLTYWERVQVLSVLPGGLRTES